MRKRYSDCKRADGNCAVCPMIINGKDCHNQAFSKIRWYRMAAGMSQLRLAEKSGINIRQIQKLEKGEIDVDRVMAKNIVALADALEVNARYLL